MTLCSPDDEKTCFACCPPIRPAGYEHQPYRNIIRRILRENTRQFDDKDDRVVPITGFSCWALGYLDKEYKRIGCLLHPSRNAGIDLRHRVDYGEKCRRETCPEAKVFSRLEIEVQAFWLQLADGLDSFAYSSPSLNPLFGLMGWGEDLLGLVAAKEKGKPYTVASFFEAYPFFKTHLRPRANAYLLDRLTKRGNVARLKRPGFREAFEHLSAQLSTRLSHETGHAADGLPVHQLDLDPRFCDFLRLSLHRTRLPMKEALRLKELVEQQTDHFLRDH